MRVFVTGATGAVGPPTLRALLAAGHQVTALTRTPEKAGLVRGLGATPVAVSLFDTGALTEAFAGHDAVANLATAIPGMSSFFKRSAWEECDRIRTEGSAAVAGAVTAAGVTRLVQESIAFNHASSQDWIDEDSPLDPIPVGEPALTAESNAVAAGGTALRFGLFYGAESDHTRALFDAARKGVGLFTGPPDVYYSSIHLDDAATAVVAALEAPSGVFLVADDEPLTRREYADAIGAAVGRTIRLRVPGRMVRLAGPMTESVVRSYRVSNRRWRDATGWAPTYPSVREGWAAIVKEMTQHA